MWGREAGENVNKKILIAVIAVVMVIVISVAYLLLKPSPEDLRASWTLYPDTRRVSVYLSNYNNYGILVYGAESINVSRIELIYIPENTSGLLWVGQFILKPDYTVGVEVLRAENVTSDFFNLLWGSRWEGDVKIIVETTKTVYTFVPPKWQHTTSPTERRAK